MKLLFFKLFFARDHDFLTKIKIVEVRKKIIRAPILKVRLGRRQGLTSSISDEARCWRWNSSQGRRENTLEVSYPGAAGRSKSQRPRRPGVEDLSLFLNIKVRGRIHTPVYLLSPGTLLLHALTQRHPQVAEQAEGCFCGMWSRTQICFMVLLFPYETQRAVASLASTLVLQEVRSKENNTWKDT